MATEITGGAVSGAVKISIGVPGQAGTLCVTGMAITFVYIDEEDVFTASQS